MTDSTQKESFVRKATSQVKQVVNVPVRKTLHASADALLFVQLFARACNAAACQ